MCSNFIAINQQEYQKYMDDMWDKYYRFCSSCSGEMDRNNHWIIPGSCGGYRYCGSCHDLYHDSWIGKPIHIEGSGEI